MNPTSGFAVDRGLTVPSFRQHLFIERIQIVPLTYQEIAEILRIIDTSSIDEFVVEVGDIKVAVRRKSAEASGNDNFLQTPDPEGPASQPKPQTAASASSREETTLSEPLRDSGERSDGLARVCAPMSGIFYRKPSPDAEPFVAIGSTVKKGDSLCLVEVMKLFNTICAEFDGRIIEIGAEEGDLVEYNQVLFLIEPIRNAD